MSDSEDILAAALLWIRNQYDVGDQSLKQAALDRIDAVLADHEPSLSGMKQFRDIYLKGKDAK